LIKNFSGILTGPMVTRCLPRLRTPARGAQATAEVHESWKRAGAQQSRAVGFASTADLSDSLAQHDARPISE
jgi:hypothetical protein